MFFMLNDFQSLHRVLTAYIKAFCYLSFSPNDAKTSEAVEPDLSNRILNLIQDHTQGVQLPDLRTRYPGERNSFLRIMIGLSSIHPSVVSRCGP